jgi:hypothetical protein
MTAELCMAFCKSNSYTYAGIEYTKYVLSGPILRRYLLGLASIEGFQY